MTRSDWIAVLGGAARYTDADLVAAYDAGAEIARLGKGVITGATGGIPYAAALGAKSGGARVVGISPGVGLADHNVRFGKPFDAADIILYTGLGVEGRGSVIVRSARGAIFIGGEFGTLIEFGAAYLCGDNVLGVLTGTSGITDHIADLISHTVTDYGSEVVYESNAVLLARRVCAAADLRQRASVDAMELVDHGSSVRASLMRTGRTS